MSKIQKKYIFNARSVEIASIDHANSSREESRFARIISPSGKQALNKFCVIYLSNKTYLYNLKTVNG